VAEKSEKLDEVTKEQFGGSRLSKFLYSASMWILICLAVSFFAQFDAFDRGTIVSSRWAWEVTVACAIAWLCTAVLAYRLAGGRRNPFIWEDLSLFELLKYAWESGDARIGFHSLRDQKNLLTDLSSAGIKKGPFKDTRQFLRGKITDRKSVV
jgi:hypothetical protein